MSSIVHVTLENFEETVIHGSMQRPVIVEFIAEWNPQSKQQALITEKLSKELDFTLARIDVDQNQQLVAHFRLSALPDIRVFSKGKMVDFITGVVTEEACRKRLSRHFLSEFDLALIQAETLQHQGKPMESIQLLDTLLLEKPNDRKVLYSKAKALVDTNATEQAKAILALFQEGDDFFREARSLSQLMDFHQVLSQKDLTDATDLAYQKACGEALGGAYQQALDGFLAIVQSQPNWKNGQAKNAMLTLFGVLGPKHALTWEYRAKLNTILFV